MPTTRHPVTDQRPDHRQRTLLSVAIATVLLMMVPASTAHPVYPVDGFTRLAHDCNDDYGGHNPSVQYPAHQLHAVDFKEDPDQEVVILLTVLDIGYHGQPLGPDWAHDTFLFHIERDGGLVGKFQTGIRTQDPDNYDIKPATGADSNFPDYDFIAPAKIEVSDHMTNTNPPEPDGHRRNVEIHLHYDALDAHNGDRIKAPHSAADTLGSSDPLSRGVVPTAISYADGAKGDILPMGRYSTNGNYNPTCVEDEQSRGWDEGWFLLETGFKIENSPLLPPGEAINAAFTYTCQSVECTFDASATTGPAEATLAYQWDFGDGLQSQGETVTHTYEEAGTYTVALSVESDNDQDTTSQEVTVHSVLTAAFTMEPTRIETGTTVRFIDESVAGALSITGWEWNFGDGTTSAQQNPEHTYQRGGSYEITLTVTDEGDDTDSTSRTITVHWAAQQSTDETDDGATDEDGSTTDDDELPGQEIPAPTMFFVIFSALATIFMHRRKQ